MISIFQTREAKEGQGNNEIENFDTNSGGIE